MKTLLAILLLAMCSFAQTTALAVPTVAQLLGSWRLVSVEVTLKDGTVKPDDRFGPRPLGYIMYEPDGHMCAEIMNPDRAAWKNPTKPTDEEKLRLSTDLLPIVERTSSTRNISRLRTIQKLL